MSGSDQIEVRQEQGGVLHLIINRPERKNALTMAMYSALAAAIDGAGAGVRVILLSGAGDGFTGGNDLEDFVNNPPAGEDSPVARFMQALYHTEKPVAAAVHGHAVGIGTTLLLHCDLVYAADNARFQMPFVKLGLCPEYASSMILPRIMGHVKAAELLLLGEPFSAAEAAACGIVNREVAAAELLDYARQRCHQLAQLPPAAVRNTKRLMKEVLGEQGQQAIRREMAYFSSGLQSDEFAEAAAAFFEKRPADFSRFS
ncbi:enoyl-CoA hydratase [Exilibacterium tricleocarpae]|uniref:Enoyl-CoA hydratase n=1 Tax=Exilibacterium tricleocarpae TaxID=2591008 RepID=A0A545U599_9GAMM|nr:enoyl-CoA hydratase [Exilibacterium tricleocarpae]TQV84642.1 enoyl-CoA hydratase [Exilibacterium tricleocarpae]